MRLHFLMTIAPILPKSTTAVLLLSRGGIRTHLSQEGVKSKPVAKAFGLPDASAARARSLALTIGWPELVNLLTLLNASSVGEGLLHLLPVHFRRHILQTLRREFPEVVQQVHTRLV